MKFACERDVLGEALGAAARAVSTRHGSLPVLSGVRLELRGNDLTLTGSDLDLTISVNATVAGAADGVAVLPRRHFYFSDLEFDEGVGWLLLLT